MDYHNDIFDTKMNMIHTKMIRKWKVVTLERSIQKNSIEADRRSETSLLE